MINVEENKTTYMVNDVVMGEVDYPYINKDTVNITHTFVDNSLRGQGIADKLMTEVFKYLNKGYLRDFYHEKRYVKKYKGYVVWAIDGSKEEIPNTKQNKTFFGIMPGGKGKDKVARALMSGAYDVCNNFGGIYR